MTIATRPTGRRSAVRACEKLAAFVRATGIAMACVLIPAQILVSLVFVVGRNFFSLPATALQELEWHFFAAAVFLTLGAALLADRHVRVDVLRQRLSERARARVEIVGFLLSLLPFCAAVTYSGAIAAWDVFWIGEGSGTRIGLP